MLDVATGTGNVAVRAAAAGADVVGLDLAPELFETARPRAARLGPTVKARERLTAEGRWTTAGARSSR